MSAVWTERLRAAPAVARAARELADTGRSALSGACGPARLALPLLAAPGPWLVVVAHERDVDGTVDDLRTIAGEAGLEGVVLPFPAPGPPPFRGLGRHPDAVAQRATLLHAAARGRLLAMVASPAGLLRPTLPPRLFETRVLSLKVGEELTPEILLEALDEGGYRREDPVTAPGQVAQRGGIVDVFPTDRELPVRCEFLGDTLESLREFDPETQRTVLPLDTLETLPLADLFPTRSVLARLRAVLEERFADHRDKDALLEKIDRGYAHDELVELVTLVPDATVAVWHHLRAATTLVLEPEDVAAEIDAFHAAAAEEKARHEDLIAPTVEQALVPAAALHARLAEAPLVHVRGVDLDAFGTPVPCRPVRRYNGDLRALVADLKASRGHRVVMLGTPGRRDRLAEILREDDLVPGPDTGLELRVGVLSQGFELPDVPLLLYSDGDVFPEEVHVHGRGRSRRSSLRGFLSDFRDLKVGDLVVHQDHGIGRFVGLETLQLGDLTKEFMVLAYQGGDKLKVPVDTFDRVQKYASAEGARPAVDKLGSGQWDKVKTRVKKAMRDMAAELLKLYAQRKARPGHSFTPDSPWLREFEESFEYQETPDQAGAIADVAADMAAPTPMDRLICGDVGYGKTEVAMRAAMRAVLDGKQVAVLTPTTVLSFQHWKTFRKRFAPFPVKVEMVSRFRSAKDVRQVLAALKEGKVDILIGTHRLLSRDVEFKDLGLMIIDEEQRFGVAAKERLKHLRTTIDCLTLSATPIPRTLQMGLAGIRDMSVIETPPKDRLAINTSIVKFSPDVISAAVKQELARDGQVYVVHHRVESIYALAGLVQRVVPEARVVVAHGQMPEGELEKQMLAFVEGRADVLVATTIIENGLDIPRANTLIVNRADRYGLAQLYQLRGRVGRSDRRAYAYLMVPPETVLSEIARKRLAAIQEFSDLGAGFRIAALDLELRGAGNLLGGQQSGHIHAIGLDLYIKLLEQTILELKGEAPPEQVRATLNLRIDLRVPPEYVPDVHQRMSLYKRVSQVTDAAQLDALRAEMRDRYGAFPPQVESLLSYAALRVRAEALGIQQVDLTAQALHLRFTAETPLSAESLPRVVRALPGSSFSPQGVLRIPIAPEAPALAVVDGALRALEQAAARSSLAAV